MNQGVFKKVYEIVHMIPKGKVMTYGQVADQFKIDARVVGWALHANRNPKVPCHRVVDRNGRLAEAYAFGGRDEQRKRLKGERVIFRDKNHVNLLKCLFRMRLHKI